MSRISSPNLSCTYGYPSNLSQLIVDVRAEVPHEILARYEKEACINSDLTYKLPQLIAGASNDAAKHNMTIPERARDVVEQCILIREVLSIGSILDDEYFPRELSDRLEKFSSLSVVGEDNKGNTIIYFDLQNFDAKEYKVCWEMGQRPIPSGFVGHSEFDDPCVVNYCSLWYVRMMQWIHSERFGAFKRGEVAEPRVVMVLNIDSIGYSTYSHELRQFLKGIRILGGFLYPEICDYIFAANVPWIADKFWPVIKLVLHHATASKVHICDKNRTRRNLPPLILPSQLPPALGGTMVPERKFKRGDYTDICTD